MEVFISFLAGFSIGWASVWFIFCMKELKDTSEEGLDYNMIEKSLGEFVDSQFDPENYLGQGEGTK
jgi:hypothetical protein